MKVTKKFYVTQEGYEKLYNDISGMDKLHDDVERQMGESVKRDNDLRENPEYMALRVQAMYGIPAQKRDLVLKFQNAIIIEETPEYLEWDGVTVIRKSKVKMSIDGEDEEYTILGSDEGSINDNILSCDAAIVQSILGHKVGEKVLFNGMIIEIKEVSKLEQKQLKKVRNEEE